MKLLSVREAALRLGVSGKLVYALCAAGRIAHERYGLGRGTIRIAEEALEQYRKSCAVGSPFRGDPTARRARPLRLKHLEA